MMVQKIIFLLQRTLDRVRKRNNFLSERSFATECRSAGGRVNCLGI